MYVWKSRRVAPLPYHHNCWNPRDLTVGTILVLQEGLRGVYCLLECALKLQGMEGESGVS